MTMKTLSSMDRSFYYQISLETKNKFKTTPLGLPVNGTVKALRDRRTYNAQ